MKISIIIPVFNVSSYIERCLQSVFNQTYSNIECIIIDDCSPDDSMEKVNSILLQYPKAHTKIIRHEKNGGLSAARNNGVRQATGDYIFFLDSDDELPLDSIEVLISYIRHTPDFIISEYQIEGSGKNKIPKLSLNDQSALHGDDILSSFLKRKWYEMACNKLINRTFFIHNDLWFKEGVLHEDTLWSFQLAIKADSMIVSKKKTYIYYLHSNSITQTKNEKNINSMFLILSEMIDSAKSNDIDNQLFSTYAINFYIYISKNIFFSNQSFPKKREWIHKLNEIALNYSFSVAKLPFNLFVKYYLIFLFSKILILWTK